MRGERRAAYWMAAPALIAVFAVVVYPLTFATYYSLKEVRGNLIGGFVGLANYVRAANDPSFVDALSTTLLFTVASASFSFLAGLGLALLLSRPFAGRSAVAAAVFLPWVFPVVVTATFGRLALGDGGPVQSLSGYLGLWDGGPLLGNPDALLFSSVLVDVWRTTPFVALLLLAGMRTIPKDIYEAASVEGAGPLQKFFLITLPLLRPTIMIVLLIRLLDAFRVQDLFLIMGGRQLESLSIYVYQNVLLSQINFGLGSAAAVFIFACALSLALLFTVVLKAQLSTGLVRSSIQNVMDEATGRTSIRRMFPTAATGILLAIAFLAPPAWVLWMSVTLSSGASGGSPISFSPGLYQLILSNGSVLAGLANSVIIAGLTTLLTLLLSCSAAYAIARIGFRYGNGLLSVMLAAAFFPPVAVLVPMLVQLKQIGVTGTQLGAILPDTVFFTPFAVWLLATFFRELPVEVEDAARVDGAGRLQVLTRVILPLAAPAVFTTGAFVFVLSWNEFVFASTFTFDTSRPITVVLADFVATIGLGAPAAPLAAVSLVATLPPMLLFLVFRRRILSGLTGGALARSRKIR